RLGTRSSGLAPVSGLVLCRRVVSDSAAGRRDLLSFPTRRSSDLLFLLGRRRLLPLGAFGGGGGGRHPLRLHPDAADRLSDVSHLTLLPADGNGRGRRGRRPARRRRSTGVPSAPPSSPARPGSRVRARSRARRAPPGR